MELFINGNKIEIPDHVNFVVDLLQHLKLEQKVVIVEINGVILEKGDHQETRFSDGDKIEIVHFVGGG